MVASTFPCTASILTTVWPSCRVTLPNTQIDLVSSCQDHVISSHRRAIRDGRIYFSMHRLHFDDRMAFVQSDLAKHPDRPCIQLPGSREQLSPSRHQRWSHLLFHAPPPF